MLNGSAACPLKPKGKEGQQRACKAPAHSQLHAVGAHTPRKAASHAVHITRDEQLTICTRAHDGHAHDTIPVAVQGRVSRDDVALPRACTVIPGSNVVGLRDAVCSVQRGWGYTGKG